MKLTVLGSQKHSAMAIRGHKHSVMDTGGGTAALMCSLEIRAHIYASFVRVHARIFANFFYGSSLLSCELMIPG